jgi:hypothetical protein
MNLEATASQSATQEKFFRYIQGVNNNLERGVPMNLEATTSQSATQEKFFRYKVFK